MKRYVQIVDGKRYDTTNARELCDISSRGYDRGDSRYEDTRLFVTKNGRFFIAGSGGPLSRWSEASGRHGLRGSEGIRPIHEKHARDLLEHYGVPKQVEEFFSIEDA
jgi:hypothetical protein